MMGAVYSASRRRAAQSGPSPVFSPSFTTGAVPSGATVTRSGTATRVNASGIVESVAANVVRLDYAPATLTARGVLIESSTTNLFGANTDFSLTSTRVGITAATSAVLSPDGSTVAQSLTTATGDCYVGMQSLTNVGQAHTISVYVKRGNCDYIALLLNNSGSTITYFNIATGAVGNVGTDTTAAIEAYPGGWYRVSATSAAGDGNYYIQPALRNNGIFDNSQTGDFNYVWGAQVELGGASTSLIMTPSSTVTRSADTVSLTASNGSYDILIRDAEGGEWRNAVTVSGGSYPITPRSGKRHVQSIAAYAAGVLSQPQKDALLAGSQIQWQVDFAGGTVPAGVTATRAGTGATRTTSAGLVQTVAANAARPDYHPQTLVYRGMLAEPAATNLFLNATDFSQASWTKTNGTIATSAVLSPDGTGFTQSFTCSAADCVIFRAMTVTDGSTYTYSFFAKRGNVDWIVMVSSEGGTQRRNWYNLANGTVGTTQSPSAGMQAYPNGWYRCWATFAASSGTYYIHPAVPNNGSYNNSTSGNFNYLWGAQLELGGAPTSLIVSGASAVTRNADVLSAAVPNGSYDIKIINSDDTFWVTGVTVSNGAYTLTPPAGVFHVIKVEAYPVGTTSAGFSHTFSTSALPGNVTVTRSTSATTLNASSQVETVSANAGRVNYSPLTRTSRGLLIEPAATNLFTQSSAFTDAAWTKTAVTAAAGDILAPDGTTFANKLTTTGTTCTVGRTMSFGTAGQTHTFSVYAKRGNADHISMVVNVAGTVRRAHFDIARGRPGLTTVHLQPRVYDVGNGWFRCSITFAASNGTYAVHPAVTGPLSTTNTSGDYGYLWGAQLELGSEATSLIQTGAATAARSADVVTVSMANGSYDILVKDHHDAEWRNAVAVTGGAYPLIPRAGHDHIHSVAAYPAGVLTATQKADLLEQWETTPEWTANFETTTLDGWAECSYVQGIDPSQGPGAQYNFVGPASAVGITAKQGTRVAQFQRVAFNDSLPHSKMFKEWSNTTPKKNDQFGRAETALSKNNDPNGIYSTWVYFPADYDISLAQGDWANITQHKEEGTSNDGSFRQDPSWGTTLSNQARWTGNGLPNVVAPFLFNFHWEIDWANAATPEPGTGLPYTLIPLGRWFEIRHELVEGERMDWYVDGKFIYSCLDSMWPVGRFYRNSTNWIFGIGHYLGQGKCFFDRTYFRRFPQYAAKGIQLNGANTCITYADTASWDFADANWTVGAFVSVGSNAGSGAQYIISTGALGAVNTFNFILNEASAASNANTFEVVVRGAGSAITLRGTANATLADSTWRLWTIERSGTTLNIYHTSAKGTRTLYASGSLSGIGAITNAGVPTLGTSSPQTIGNGNWFNGSFHRFFKSPIVLTAAQTAQVAENQDIQGGLRLAPDVYTKFYDLKSPIRDAGDNGNPASIVGNASITTGPIF